MLVLTLVHAPIQPLVVLLLFLALIVLMLVLLMLALVVLTCALTKNNAAFYALKN